MISLCKQRYFTHECKNVGGKKYKDEISTIIRCSGCWIIETSILLLLLLFEVLKMRVWMK